MKNILYINLLSILILSCVVIVPAQDNKSNPKPDNQQSEEITEDEDRIYSPSEVDTRAKIKHEADGAPQWTPDCPKKGRVRITAVLRKSGEVTDVELVKGMGCGYDEKAVEATRKLNFSPAMKEGHAVSQYLRIEYQYERY